MKNLYLYLLLWYNQCPSTSIPLSHLHNLSQLLDHCLILCHHPCLVLLLMEDVPYKYLFLSSLATITAHWYGLLDFHHSLVSLACVLNLKCSPYLLLLVYWTVSNKMTRAFILKTLSAACFDRNQRTDQPVFCILCCTSITVFLIL